MTDFEFFQFTFEVAMQTRQIHHVTESDPVHRALGDFYDEWNDITDKYIETFQGRYGRVYGNYVVSSTSEADCELYLLTARMEVENRIKATEPIDSDLINILADLRGLINHTLYRLTLKK